MSTVVEQTELVRKAVVWLDEHCRQGKSLHALLDEAGMRFNLSPKEQEFLKNLFRARKQEC